MATNFDKIDCHQVKTLFYETYSQGKVSALEHSSAKSSVLKPHRIQVIIKYAKSCIGSPWGNSIS